MASKSKKRRRVLGASCILAALIIAGSSFAWFTSKDEVTNRLAASADYNVSIIENFVPPKQWVPGQTVKKEEGVVNTGAIDAFVKQTVSGNLQVTVEVPTTVDPTTNPTDKEDYVTLTQYEFGTLEAGSTLAWLPEADNVNKKGVIIGMGINGDEGDNKEFDPAAKGLYVFRRAVHKDATANTDDGKFKDQSYDYVGYYYDGTGTYYKLYNLKVDDGEIVTAADDNTDPNGRGYMLYGTLKSEPLYSFSKKVTTTENKVKMVYENLIGQDKKDGNGNPIDARLKVTFNGKNAVDEAISATDSEIYSAFHDYLDYYNGRTNYVAPTTASDYSAYTTWDTPSVPDSNKTGLTDYDIYNNTTAGQDDANAAGTGSAKGDLSNFGYERLDALKAQTKAVRDDKEANLTTNETNAQQSRKKINTGRNAQTELNHLYTEVTNLIGVSIYDADTNDDNNPTGIGGAPSDSLDPGPGLYLIETKNTTDATKNASTFEWYAKQLYDPADPNNDKLPYIMNVKEDDTWQNLADTWFVTDSNQAKHMTFKLKSVAGDESDATIFSVDTLKQPRFADPEQTTNDATDTADDFGSGVIVATQEAPYIGDVTDDTLKVAWGNLLKQTQRKALNLIKQKMLQEVIDTTDPASTDAARKIEEATAYKNFLIEQMNKTGGIQDDYEAAVETYETIAGEVHDMLKLMNDNQGDVDIANAEYNGYYGGYNTALGTDGAVTSYNPTTWSQTNAKTVVYGNEDSVYENTFEQQLLNIFGVAKKDTTTDAITGTGEGDDITENHASYKSTYRCEHDANTDGTVDHTTADLPTYGYSSTRYAITRNLTTDDDDTTKTGVTSWKGALATTDPKIAEADKDPVMGAPFYKDYITGKMKDFREKQAAAKYADYQKLLQKKALYNANATTSTNNVELYVNLVNIAELEGTPAEVKEKDTWQYMGTETPGTAATDFIFGYTGILETGEVSELLIKSVEFASSTKQEAFKDMKFDLNVASESAQVVFNGPRVQSDAAKSGISEISPTDDEYVNSDDAKVTWELDATGTVPTDKDPFYTEKNVTPKTYKYVAGGTELTNAPEAVFPALEVSNGETGADAKTLTMNYKFTVTEDVSGTPTQVTYYGESITGDYYQLDASDSTKIDKTTKKTVTREGTVI